MTKGRLGGRLSGLHVSPKAGMSVEFADYREYHPGDDIRYVDWNIYGRLERLLVKSFIHESDLPIYLLVDVSASMRIGTPAKLEYAAKLALALAHLGLHTMDRVGVFPFAHRLLGSVPAQHGPSHIRRVYDTLSRLSAHDETAFERSVMGFLSVTRETGLVLVVSDFLFRSGIEEGFGRMLHRGDEVAALQVLAPEELDPARSGTAQVVDVETGRFTTLNLGPTTLASYRERLDEHQARLQTFLEEQRVPLFTIPTDRSLETVIFKTLREGGIVR
jgi:uncharacterized protein (DUF58 family)